jgi:cytochrome c oxidase subunit 3
LLLSSGVTITIAHHALQENLRGRLILFMFLTIALGLTFLGLQAFEYSHAYSELNLKLSTGIYGSTFFMLTGFHGFHVTVGATMLIVILVRCMKGHFKPEHHFAFEGVAWYWHFVDVVWLGLFVCVYWLYIYPRTKPRRRRLLKLGESPQKRRQGELSRRTMCGVFFRTKCPGFAIPC